MCLRYWRILAQPFHFRFNVTEAAAQTATPAQKCLSHTYNVAFKLYDYVKLRKQFGL